MTIRATLLLLLAAAGAVSGLLQTGPLFKGSRFAPHPKGCAAGHMHITSEQWWMNENGRGKTPPTGAVSHEFCAPYGQVLKPAGRLGPTNPLNITQTQHKSNATIVRWSISLARNQTQGLFYFPKFPCNEDMLECDITSKRSSSPARNCTLTGGRITANHGPGAGITCAWTQKTQLDMGRLVESGTSYMAVATFMNSPKDMRTDNIPRIVKLITNVFTVLPDSTAKPCKDTGPIGEPWFCNMEHPFKLGLRTSAWTEGVTYTLVDVGPVFPFPVGGKWRLRISASRLQENPPWPANAKPVHNHLVTLNPNFKTGVKGVVVREGKGPLVQKQMVLDLPRLLGNRSGWQQLVVQAKATDTGDARSTEMTQTVNQGLLFEVVPRCPPNNSPFLTSVLEDSAVTLNINDGMTEEHSFFGLDQRTGEGIWTLWLRNIPPPPVRTPKPSWISLSFDLTFLDPRAVVTEAKMIMSSYYVEGDTNNYNDLPLTAWDASKSYISVCGPAGNCPQYLPLSRYPVPCVAPFCDKGIKVGSGVINGKTAWNRFQTVNLNTAWVTRHVNQRKKLEVAVTMMREMVTYGGIFFRSSNWTGGGVAYPMLMLRATCP